MVAFLATAAFADWDPGDDYKMHFPQLPDPNGWDVNFIQPKVLADDWQCTETGYVTDIHFWLSSRQDMPFDIQNIHASIHTDDLSGPFSKPGHLLWQADFQPGTFTIRDDGSGPQGWYDPNPPPVVEPSDHFMTYQVNITNIPDPFVQLAGTVYWLDLSVTAFGPAGPAQLGWKTSFEHFRDDAVWADFSVTNGVVAPGGSGNFNNLVGPHLYWEPLVDPFTGQTLDLAFVITGRPVGEPGGLALIGAAVAAIRKRRRR